MIRIKKATLRDVTFIGANLRPQDVEELGCQVEEGTKLSEVAARCFQGSENRAYIAMYKGQPACAFGVGKMNSWQGSAWAFGTNNMKRCVPKVTKFITKKLIPLCVKDGLQRVEVRPIASHEITCQWLEGMGAEYEALLKNYGRNGQDFKLFSWIKE